MQSRRARLAGELSRAQLAFLAAMRASNGTEQCFLIALGELVDGLKSAQGADHEALLSS